MPHIQGYKMKEYDIPTKRYCQTLSLKNDPMLIEEYRKIHSEEKAWPEIRAGIRAVGILEMEIYILGSQLFMIIETPLDYVIVYYLLMKKGIAPSTLFLFY